MIDYDSCLNHSRHPRVDCGLNFEARYQSFYEILWWKTTTSRKKSLKLKFFSWITILSVVYFKVLMNNGK